jgi:Asparaginase
MDTVLSDESRRRCVAHARIDKFVVSESEPSVIDTIDMDDPRPSSAIPEEKYVLVIHGGAGTISKQGSTPEQQAQYKAALRRSLRAGYDVLHSRGEAMDAAVAAVAVLEGQTKSLFRYVIPNESIFRLPFLQCREGCCVQY